MLLLQGRSYRSVVEVVGCSHRDVAAARRVMTAHGITAQGLAVMSQTELAGLFPDGRSKVSEDYLAPDFAKVVASMRANRHFTLLQAWRRYTTVESSLRKYGYSQYCFLFAEYVVTHDLVAVLHHEPGRAVFADWAGDTVPLIDEVTGQVVKAYLFVAVLPFSGLVWCRAFTDMRMESWISAHVQLFAAIGGVTQIIVPDNALTATRRGGKGDPARFVTDRYQQMADHYHTAIVPARVKKPRDKAAVESGVNVVNTRVLGYLLEEVWTVLEDLNTAIAERVYEINHDIRRADGTTRWELFTTQEAPLLAPLPLDVFEHVEWKEAKVQRNSHITVDYQHYSVPFQHAGQLVRVRLTTTSVTVFDGEQVLAKHPRQLGRKGQYSTDVAHLPHQHRHVDQLWSRQWFTDRAKAFGPATTTVIGQLLDQRGIEEQGYLECQNILETLGRKNKQRLEAACQTLVNMAGHPSYSMLKRLMASIEGDRQAPGPLRAAASTRKPVPATDVAVDVYVRGADYYRDGK